MDVQHDEQPKSRPHSLKNEDFIDDQALLTTHGYPQPNSQTSIYNHPIEMKKNIEGNDGKDNDRSDKESIKNKINTTISEESNSENEFVGQGNFSMYDHRIFEELERMLAGRKTFDSTEMIDILTKNLQYLQHHSRNVQYVRVHLDK
jgi:hypothetical protein